MPIDITAPAGMTGLAVRTWGDIYAVAANWSQASSPVMVYGIDGWTYDGHGRQVADFSHNDRDALESVLIEAVRMSGDDPDDCDFDSILDRAEEISGE